MNNADPDRNIVPIKTRLSAYDKDKRAPNTLVKSKRSRTGVEDESVSKRKKNIPKNIYIITSDKDRSKEVVARAMAEMYRRMLNPV